MVCIYCDSNAKTAVVNSRSSSKTHTTWRRRQCKHCDSIVTTREYIDLETALRINTSNGLKPFLRDRLFVDIYNVVSHRKTALSDATELTDTIISTILTLHDQGILESSTLVKTAYDIVRRFDPAAGVAYEARYILN